MSSSGAPQFEHFSSLPLFLCPQYLQIFSCIFFNSMRIFCFSSSAFNSFSSWSRIISPLGSKLNDMASLLHGEMDFTAFASSKDQSISKSRYIYNAVFFPQGENVVVFEITANAFLWRMVRSLTGTMVELESAPDPKMVFQEILESSDRAKAGATAPPQGLFLWDVSYFN